MRAKLSLFKQKIFFGKKLLFSRFCYSMLAKENLPFFCGCIFFCTHLLFSCLIPLKPFILQFIDHSLLSVIYFCRCIFFCRLLLSKEIYQKTTLFFYFLMSFFLYFMVIFKMKIFCFPLFLNRVKFSSLFEVK